MVSYLMASVAERKLHLVGEAFLSTPSIAITLQNDDVGLLLLKCK